MDTLTKLDRPLAEEIAEMIPAKWSPQIFKRGPQGMGVRFGASGRNAPQLVEAALAIVKPIKRGHPHLQYLVEVTEENRGFRASAEFTTPTL